MPVLGRFVIDWLREVKLLDNHARPHIEVLLNNFDQLLARLVASSVCFHEHTKWLSDTDGIRKLDKRTSSEFRMYKRFCDPTCQIRCGTVDLAVVFAGEGAASVGTPASVGINDDLSASETSVTLWPSNNKQP